MSLGLHLIATASGCAACRLEDPAVIRDLLQVLPRRLGLNPVGEPVLHRQPAGWVGMALLRESHVTVHALPAERAAFADLFSCRVFDPRLAVEIVQAALAAEAVEWDLIERGPAGAT